MRKKLFVIKVVFEVIRCFPHLMLLAFHKNRSTIYADVAKWMEIYILKYNTVVGFLYLMSFYPEFRNVFYFRVGNWKYFINFICPRLSSLYIYTPLIGKGLFIQHGFATIIAAKSLGDNCWINQQVTIGYSNETDLPTIGDDVTINAGAKVIGKAIIGNKVIIGANAVVVKNVPNNCTVVGVPAYIIKKNGIKCHQAL